MIDDVASVFSKRFLSIVWCLSVLLLLGSCDEEGPKCDSTEVRGLVVKAVADDRNNPLINFAVRNSNVAADTTLVSPNTQERSAKAEAGKALGHETGKLDINAETPNARERAKDGAVYVLDSTIFVNSRSRSARTVSCSGQISVTVADTTAQKQIDFSVEQLTDGAIRVSVQPFLF